MTPRQAFIDQFLKDTAQILPGTPDIEYYTTYLNGLSDEAFERLVDDIESGKVILPVYEPNFSKVRLSVERNLKVGEAWGHQFFERLIVHDATDPSIVTMTPKRYLVLELPWRRQIQTLTNKMSVPMNNDHIDELTGQPTGESKVSSLTYPELQLLYAEQRESSIIELMKVRGGDSEAYQRMEEQIIQNGTASLKDATVPGSRAKSTDTLKTLLTGAHLGNNL